MILVNNVTKRFGDVTAVCDFSFQFEAEEGHIYVIRGVSGSGKSTLLGLIGYLDTPTEGTINLEGLSIASSRKEKARHRREMLGFVFQDFQLNPAYTALENVMVPLLINPKYTLKDTKERAQELLDLMGLTDRITHYPSQLSGGEKQRVSIARALANEPKYILADEPTANLDLDNEKLVLDQFAKLRALRKTVIIASHSEQTWEYADTLLTMKSGRLIEVHHVK
ncbi:ABC transporter ATP-binding protein [Fusibacter bizertensis]